ncbi:chaperonin 10-like protein [Pseudomassariella vexata]|uniref:Chaperonin 10-like protein n=1 Tax=Pseudomassariella vexata TaxID=1141098 RepID=A0A1Y2EKA9_9PEZI|nr:chaperonin 10-like protein [Pseudomassariella vexata]ORY71960.1 chaperonin 10-like protein [Pseudomassariella vexata]
MPTQKTQTAIIQTEEASSTKTNLTSVLPLTVSHTVPVPGLPSPNHVLVRVLAVALNPTDHKAVSHFPNPSGGVGCDFCGVIVEPQDGRYPAGTRVCGSVFPYASSSSPREDADATRILSGSFAQFVAADARLLLRVPDEWDDLHGAALGGVGWGTAGLAISDPEALALPGLPSNPATEKEPVLVYGGATASGTMACQLLKCSGYLPIAVTSATSAALAIEYGAVGTAAYTSPKCREDIRNNANGLPIRHALDCITDAESVDICFAAMARTGGHYACLEEMNKAWITRRAIRVKEVMGYEGLGVNINLGPTSSTYLREANQELFNILANWATEMQLLLDERLIKPHPVREVQGHWDGVIHGLGVLQRTEVRGQKLVVRIAAM